MSTPGYGAHPFSAASATLAALQQENYALKASLSEVVAEYNALEAEGSSSAGTLAAVTAAYRDVAAGYFDALRTVWEGYLAAGGEGGAGSAPHSAVMAALATQDRCVKRLAAAGLSDLASLTATPPSSSPDAGEAWAWGVTTGRPASAWGEERVALLAALREVKGELDGADAARGRLAAELDDRNRVLAARDAEIKRLEGALAGARSASAAAQAAAEAASETAASAMDSAARLVANSASSVAVEVDGKPYSAGDVRSLLADLERSRTTASTGSSELARVQAVMAGEAAAAQKRAHAAEASVTELQRQLAEVSSAADARVRELRDVVASSEGGAAMLNRSVAALRRELEGLQDKYAAQCGVVDLLRMEYYECQTRWVLGRGVGGGGWGGLPRCTSPPFVYCSPPPSLLAPPGSAGCKRASWTSRKRRPRRCVRWRGRWRRCGRRGCGIELRYPPSIERTRTTNHLISETWKRHLGSRVIRLHPRQPRGGANMPCLCMVAAVLLPQESLSIAELICDGRHCSP